MIAAPDRLDVAAKAAYERHVVDSAIRGKILLPAEWEKLEPATQAAWRSVAAAACAAWDGAA